MDEKFYTPQEVAAMLGVHLQTVRKWYRTGELECYKVGRVRISESQLEAFLQKRQRGSSDGSSSDGSQTDTGTDADGTAESLNDLLNF